MFSVTGRRQQQTPFEVVTVAETGEPVRARGGLSVNPAYSLDDCPRIDLLLIPGGFGTRRAPHNDKLLHWIKTRAAEAELVLSVCSGALLLAQAGLLRGLTATTHHLALDELRALSPDLSIDASRRLIDNGKVVVSAGISAGIDMSLHVVARLLGTEQALETSQNMEYDWRFSDAELAGATGRSKLGY